MFANITTEQLAPFAGFFGITAMAALCISVLIVLTARWHGHLSMDSTLGVQKAHVNPTPRVGGVGIYGSLLLVWLLLPEGDTRQILGLVVLAGLPAWLFGLAEDLTKRVGVLPRLLATMFSGIVACAISDVALTRLDIPLLDDLLTFWPVAVLFTAFAVGGVANAINIIDGFHGLASGTSILALLALAVLALLAGDIPLAVVCLLVACAVAGFWLMNYPWGKIFLGDGGAYFTGFALAWLAVLLPMRNPDTSPWASLMVCAYPFIEVIYSMLRRKLENRSMGEPDSRHLHSLLASQFIRRHFRELSHGLQNAAVAPFIWLFKAALVLLAIALRDSTPALAVSLLLAVLAYHVVYRSLSRRLRPPVSHR